MWSLKLKKAFEGETEILQKLLWNTQSEIYVANARKALGNLKSS